MESVKRRASAGCGTTLETQVTAGRPGSLQASAEVDDLRPTTRFRVRAVSDAANGAAAILRTRRT